MGKTNFFFSTLPFSPWALLATWQQVGAPQKYRKNELNTHFEQNFTTGSYRVKIGRAWCSRKACEICSSLVQKQFEKIYFSSHKLLKLQLKKKIPVCAKECYVAYKFHLYFEDVEDPIMQLSVYKCHT
jgi:hypothetical protein